MTTTQTNPKVDAFLRKAKKWREEMKALRAVILDSPLTEEVKWRLPCYTLDGKNIVLINGLKEFCALAFFKGALLKDPKRILKSRPAAGSNSPAFARYKSSRLR